MEYPFYLEQKFHDAGRLETRILTAQEAEALGYEDDYRTHGEDYTLYVDGYSSLKAIQNFLDEIDAINKAYEKPRKEGRKRGGER